MASSTANVENVKVTKGLGDLPKVILTSVHGRYVNGFPQLFDRFYDSESENCYSINLIRFGLKYRLVFYLQVFSLACE